MNKQTLRKISLLLVSLTLLNACTDPGETTYIGTATGGVLGAGLGAIVGNQTGDAGAGLAIGAVAGAGAGAAIGNALEAQQKSIRTQDEAIERQQKILAAQNAEIQELRGTPTDTYPAKARIDYNSSEVRGSLSREGSFTEQLNTGQIKTEQLANTGNYLSRDRAALSETTTNTVDLNNADSGSANYDGINSGSTNLKSASSTAVSAASLKGSSAVNEQDLLASTSNAEVITADPSTAKMADALGTESAECQKAEKESQKSVAAKEGADKLFYLRRAIRLCPSKAIYHKNLADQYLSLGRNEDAKAAYTDAVKLDPSLTEATQALEAISSENIY